MISAIVVSGSPVKSQQLGEPDLTVEEKKQLLMELYNTKPVVFLERYHAHLKPEHLEAFSHVSSDCRTQYYSTEVQKRALSSANKTRVRNHRYAALRALQKGTWWGIFSWFVSSFYGYKIKIDVALVFRSCKLQGIAAEFLILTGQAASIYFL